MTLHGKISQIHCDLICYRDNHTVPNQQELERIIGELIELSSKVKEDVHEMYRMTQIVDNCPKIIRKFMKRDYA